MRAFTFVSVFVLFGLTTAFPQQNVDPAYLRQYYAHLAQANRESPSSSESAEATPIYEPGNQETAPQYQYQGQQVRLKDTVNEQVRQIQQPQQAYIAPSVRQYQQQAPAQQQVQYAPQPQQVIYKSTPVAKQTRRPAPQQYQEQGQRLNKEEPEEDYDINASYQFGFDVKDDEFTNYQNRKETRDNGIIKGSYSVVDSDGFIRTVTYTADPKEGFKAEVVREPTDIVVKVPTPAPHTESGVRHQNHQYTPAPSSAYRQQPQKYQQQQQQQQHQQQQPQYQYE